MSTDQQPQINVAELVGDLYVQLKLAHVRIAELEAELEAAQPEAPGSE